METGWRLTAAGGDPRESATEIKPPTAASRRPARVKRCGKSAPRSWQQARHGKPHPEQDQIGAAGRAGDPRVVRRARQVFRPSRPGWSLEAGSNPRPRRMAVAEEKSSRQNPAYRPAGKFPAEGPV